jgi:hypothetical protein
MTKRPLSAVRNRKFVQRSAFYSFGLSKGDEKDIEDQLINLSDEVRVRMQHIRNERKQFNGIIPAPIEIREFTKEMAVLGTLLAYIRYRLHIHGIMIAKATGNLTSPAECTMVHDLDWNKNWKHTLWQKLKQISGVELY